MSTFEPAAHLGSYGLGVYNPANGYAEAAEPIMGSFEFHAR